MKIILIFSLLMFSLVGSSQQLSEISGQVKSFNGKENLEFCSVVILDSSNVIIKGGITSKKGFFNIPIKKGDYKLAVSFIGFISDTIPLVNVHESKFIGVIFLKESNENIKGVVVKGNANINAIDKEIQIVTAEMRKGSVDTKEVLEKINGIAYDRYTNNIKVDNNKNIIILVDGVEKSQEYIKNMDPKRLKKVEIVRDPGGRYGIEGYAAVINVILNKDYQGTEAFFFNQAIVDMVPSSNGTYLPINNTYISLNHTVNNWNFYGSFSGNYNDFALLNTAVTNFNDDRMLEEGSADGKENFFSKAKSMNYTFGVDYYINPKHSISFETNIKNFPKTTSIDKGEYLAMTMHNNDTLSIYQQFMNNNSNTTNSYNTLFYRGKLSNKNSLNVDFSYSNSENNYDNEMEQELMYRQNDKGEIKTDLTKLNLEFNHQINKKMTFQLGYSNTWKQTNKSYFINTEMLNSGSASNNNYTYKSNEKRNMLSAYYSYKINSKMSMKLGLAAEQSQINVQGNSNNYLIYQPLFSFMYKVHPMLNIKLKYRSNSNYLSSSQTDSALIRIDPYTISKGNPELAPSVIHRLSLRINALQGLLSVEPYYHFSNNYIGQVGKLMNDSTFGFTYKNVGFYQHTGVKLNFTIPASKRFIIQGGLDFYSSKINIDENYENKINDWSAEIMAIVPEVNKMPMFILMYQRGNTKYINSMGYSRDENDYWLLMVQKSFLKKRLSVMIGYMLPIDYGTTYIQDTYVNINGYEKTTSNDISVIKNLIIAKLTYRFNKGKIVKKTEKNLEKELDDYSGKSLM